MKGRDEPIGVGPLVAGVLVVFSAVLLGACGGDSNQDDGVTSELNGREFLSQSVDGRSLVPGTQIRLSFDRGEIGASAGCNTLGASYGIVDGRLVVHGGGMTTTDMGCDPPRHAQDEWLAEFLQTKPNIDLGGDTLMLATANVTMRLLDRVVADPDRPLVGTRWLVDTVVREDTASSVSEHPVIIEYYSDGTLTATSTGCSSARVAVDVDERQSTMRFDTFTIDTIGCPPPWDTTVEVLRRGVVRYSIAAGRLTITAEGVGIAAFAD